MPESAGSASTSRAVSASACSAPATWSTSAAFAAFRRPAVYGAVSGRRGGFFTVGAEAAWRQQLVGPLGVELGVYVGGGGGAGAPTGGGLMLRPHADLLWDFGAYALGLSISKVHFPSGQIDSTQVGLVFNAVDTFRHIPAERLAPRPGAAGEPGFGFDRVQLVGGAYRPRSGVRLLDGSPIPETIAWPACAPSRH
jgi:hypothetical protein